MPLPDRYHSRFSRLEVRSPAEFDNIFAAIVRERADGVLFIADPIFFIQLKRMVDLIASNRLPAICNFIEFPKLGGLMGYAPSLPDEFRHAASHIDKILKGAKPADLPVEQPTRFQLCPAAVMTAPTRSVASRIGS